GGRQAIPIDIDCSIYDDLYFTRPTTLTTKLIYYCNMMHQLRRKLELNRAQSRQHALANPHRQVRLPAGHKRTREELVSLHEQAKALALLLLEWNSEFGAPATYPPSGTDPHTC